MCSMIKRKRIEAGQRVSVDMKRTIGLKLAMNLPARIATWTLSESPIHLRYPGSIPMLEMNFTGVFLERNVCGRRNSAIIVYDALHDVLWMSRIDL
jgi:hypothetical protein